MLILIPFLGLFKYLEALIFQQVKTQAETIYQQIIITRKWIAHHGGIYVEKLPWVEENPYLRLVGEKVKVFSKEGKILIKQNPALVTRQLSQLAKENNLYWFKLTSLKYLNPFNKPDYTETKALKLFENSKIREFTEIERVGEHTYYRLIKPLITERECLKCHEKQGYQVGQIRGAISIFIPLDETLTKLSYFKKLTLMIFVVFLIVLNFTILFLSNRFIFRPLYCIVFLLKILRNLYGKPHKEEKVFPKKVRNEWELLLNSINKFIEEINYYQEKMEEKIREVTKDLEEKNKALKNLLEKRKFLITNMAHEIKTPLTSIKGSIEYIKRMLEADSEIEKTERYYKLKEFFEISQKNINRLIQLFNALVDLEKAEANLLELEISLINLKEIIEEVIAQLRGLSSDKKLKFQINVREDLTLYADKEKLLIVLSNLIINAIKYSPEAGTITISAYEKDNKIRVEVEDEGKGLSEEDLDKIFERFYKKDSGGFGLGLAIAKAYVEIHKGHIGAEPREKGALFYFEIPQNIRILKNYEKENFSSRR
ncbi:MAG: phage tail tube assembly chaperone [Caldimicrobium sp.]